MQYGTVPFPTSSHRTSSTSLSWHLHRCLLMEYSLKADCINGPPAHSLPLVCLGFLASYGLRGLIMETPQDFSKDGVLPFAPQCTRNTTKRHVYISFSRPQLSSLIPLLWETSFGANGRTTQARSFRSCQLD